MANKNSINNFSELELYNIALVKRFFKEVWNEQRPEKMCEFLSSDFIIYYEHEKIIGIDNYKEKIYDVIIKAIPDVTIEVEEIIATGDHTVCRWNAQGVHEAELFGVAPSGKRIEFSGMDWTRFFNGQAVENWNNWNLSFLLQQLISEVKTLKGILPLCSFCNKIRDDNGSWEQVDVYIYKYSEADISHSVCPECLKKHYPEIKVG